MASMDRQTYTQMWNLATHQNNNAKAHMDKLAMMMDDYYSDSESDSECEPSTISMATTASYIPGASLSDKLRLAASQGQLDRVKLLIAQGAHFDADREGRTALHYAALNGCGDIVQLLISQGCDIDAKDNLGYTALHRAAAQGHFDVIKVLLSEGCLLDLQDEVHGNSALHEAAWNGYSRTLELLVKNKAHINILNKAGFSALHLSAQNGHNQSARVLLYGGIDVDYKNNYGDSALHTGARYGHAGVTRILISARCNINTQNKNGDTALHISAALKRRKIAKLLCECGIDANVRNKQNETAMDVAKRKEHSEIVQTITAQPKMKKEKKKQDKKRAAVLEDEKKEKKGFFFSRRKKKEQKAAEAAAAMAPSVAGSGPMSIAPTIGAPSEISSYAPTYAQQQHIQQLRQQHMQQMPHQQPHQQPRQPPQYTALPPQQYQSQAPELPPPRSNVPLHLQQGGPRANTRGAGTTTTQSVASGSVKGLLNQYVAKDGSQYYRDLAGNVKQGPVGFAPVCHCGPNFKRVEAKMDADRANVYDHIDATQRTLGGRLDEVDRRMMQQLYSLDKMMKERMDAEKTSTDDRINMRAMQERLQTEKQIETSGDNIRMELKAWVDARMHNLETRFTNHEENCDLAHPNCRNRKALMNGADPMQKLGSLSRWKSDETLNLSTNHPGKKIVKQRAKANHELRKLKAMSPEDRRKKFDRRSHVRRSAMELSKPAMKNDSHTGRDGMSILDYQVHRVQTSAQESPVDLKSLEGKFPGLNLQERHNNTFATMNGSSSTLHLDKSDSGIDRSKNTNSASSLPSPIYSQSVSKTGPIHSSPIETLGSRMSLGTRVDTSSNPDSGCSIPIDPMIRPSSAKSSDDSGMERHIPASISESTEDASSISDAPVAVTRHFFDTVSSQMEKWYERRLMEVEKKAEERVKQESDAMQDRISKLEQQVNRDQVKMSQKLAAAHGTEV